MSTLYQAGYKNFTSISSPGPHTNLWERYFNNHLYICWTWGIEKQSKHPTITSIVNSRAGLVPQGMWEKCYSLHCLSHKCSVAQHLEKTCELSAVESPKGCQNGVPSIQPRVRGKSQVQKQREIWLNGGTRSWKMWMKTRYETKVAWERG